MKRSEFLKTLGLTGVGLVIPNSILAQKPVKIYDNYVKGLTHYKYNQIKKQLEIGQELTLSREITNTYDAFAVAVFYGSFKLGYLPAYENIVVANLLEQGVELKSFISKLDTTDIFGAVSIEIYVNMVIENPTLIKTDLLQKRADDADDVYRKGFIK
jgi:hypothetical protein